MIILGLTYLTAKQYNTFTEHYEMLNKLNTQIMQRCYGK